MMLTAISTVLGLIPIAPTVFWGPMAFAIMGGLLVATLLTLVFLPTRVRDGVRQREADAAGVAGGRGRPERDRGDAARSAHRAARRTSQAGRGARTPRRRDAAAVQLDGSGAVSRARPRSRRPTSTSSTGRGRRRAAQPLALVVHLGRDRRRRATPRMLREAVREYFRQRARGDAAAAAATVPHRPHQPADRPGVPRRRASSSASSIAGLVSKERYALAGRGQPRDRRLGRAVAAAGDLPLRLVADPRRGAALRPAGRDGRAASTRGERRASRRRHDRRSIRRGRAVAHAAASSRGAAVLRALGGADAEREAGRSGGRRCSAASAPPGRACGCCRPTRGRVRFGRAACARCRGSCGSRCSPASTSRAARSHPRMPLQPGFRRVPAEPSRRGHARNTFATITSLLPGTVPCGDGRADAIVYHCLDVGQPVVEQLADEERAAGQRAGRRDARHG